MNSDKDKNNLLIGGGTVAGGLALPMLATNLQIKASADAKKAIAELTKKQPLDSKLAVNLRNKAAVDVNIYKSPDEFSGSYTYGADDFKDASSALLAPRVKGSGGVVRLGSAYSNPATLAHELGHAASPKGAAIWLFDKAGSGLGKASLMGWLAYNLATIGRHRGTEKQRKEALKNSLLSTGIAGLGLSAAALLKTQPVVSSEAAASKKAIGYLKEIGARDKELKAYNKALKSALKTYKAGRLGTLSVALGLTSVLGGSTYLYNKMVGGSAKK